MSTIFERMRAAENTATPAGKPPEAAVQPAAPTSPAPPPPSAPQAAPDACQCGCVRFWADAYGNLQCRSCRPPRVPAMVKATFKAVLSSAGWTWENEVPAQQTAGTLVRDVLTGWEIEYFARIKNQKPKISVAPPPRGTPLWFLTDDGKTVEGVSDGISLARHDCKLVTWEGAPEWYPVPESAAPAEKPPARKKSAKGSRKAAPAYR
jgi:hypothetical protein